MLNPLELDVCLDPHQNHLDIPGFCGLQPTNKLHRVALIMNSDNEENANKYKQAYTLRTRRQVEWTAADSSVAWSPPVCNRPLNRDRLGSPVVNLLSTRGRQQTAWENSQCGVGGTGRCACVETVTGRGGAYETVKSEKTFHDWTVWNQDPIRHKECLNVSPILLLRGIKHELNQRETFSVNQTSQVESKNKWPPTRLRLES